MNEEQATNSLEQVAQSVLNAARAIGDESTGAAVKRAAAWVVVHNGAILQRAALAHLSPRPDRETWPTEGGKS